MKKYRVNFSGEEERKVQEILNRRDISRRVRNRAQVLLFSSKGKKDEEISYLLEIGVRSICNIRKGYCEKGLELTIYGEKGRGRKKEITTDDEAEIIAYACSEPPNGRSCWTLELLREYSGKPFKKSSIQVILKKNECKPWKQKMWCIGKLTEEYRERMYNILELYALPYNSEEQMVCVDEKSKQLIEEIKKSIPGKIKRVDYEYKRNGTRNIFMAVEPKKGKRYVKVTKRRTKSDIAIFIKDLVMRKDIKAKIVHIVLDNLNTHFEKSFYEIFSEKEATDILSRIKFHYTPKHASWLNMAEIEIGIMNKQCLNRRIPTEILLKSELKAWQNERNKKNATIAWKFSKQDADNKLQKHYT